MMTTTMKVTILGVSINTFWGFPGVAMVKICLPMQEPKETCVLTLGWEDPLEEGMVIHSSILARIIPWTEEPGGLQSMESQRVKHD